MDQHLTNVIVYDMCHPFTGKQYGYSHWKRHSWSFLPASIKEKEMATHSSILAQRIPWTEEPGGLQSTVSQSRTRLSDFTSALKKLLVLTAQALMCKTTNFSNCFIHIVFTTAERMTTMSVKFSSHCSVIYVLETGLGEEVGYVC